MKSAQVFLTTVLLLVMAVTVAPARAIKGAVIFAADQIAASDAPLEVTGSITAAVVLSWERYLHQDIDGYRALLTDEAVRISQRAGQRLVGAEAITAALPAEWEAFERPDGVIAEVMTIEQAQIRVRDDRATVVYYVGVEGGSQWAYTDQGVVLQRFEQADGGWKLAYQLDSWSIDYDAEAQQPGEQTFEFAYVYPATDLDRAVAFYTPLLGAPEAVDAERAIFNLRGARFLLDTDDLGGYASIENGLPGGYAIFYVDDVEAERDRLAQTGMPFVDGTDVNVKTRGADRYVVGLDPSGNALILMERDFAAANAGAPIVTGFEGDDPSITTTRIIADAWVHMDTETLARYYDESSGWFDDTRTKVRGIESGRTAILEALDSVYWTRYDRSANRLLVTLAVSGVRADDDIVSYTMTLTGTGSHPFKDTALVAHVLNSPDHIAYTFIMAENRADALALELDYTGYPVSDLDETEAFYTDALRLGEPYTDEGWRGYWSDFGVFGIYESDPTADNLPQPERANGYVSFWVHSAQDVYDYLERQGANFPVIPAINQVSGVDDEPGYRQVYATDSEGSGVIFTEYTGKGGRRRE